MVEVQVHRRFLKTHLPVDALKYLPKAKYIYIGRDGRVRVCAITTRNVNQAWCNALNETLTVDESERYGNLAETELSSECARWLAAGDFDDLQNR